MKKIGASPPTGRKKKKDNPVEQSQRFIETAKALECDESGEKFDSAISAVITKKLDQKSAGKKP